MFGNNGFGVGDMAYTESHKTSWGDVAVQGAWVVGGALTGAAIGGSAGYGAKKVFKWTEGMGQYATEIGAGLGGVGGSTAGLVVGMGHVSARKKERYRKLLNERRLAQPQDGDEQRAAEEALNARNQANQAHPDAAALAAAQAQATDLLQQLNDERTAKQTAEGERDTAIGERDTARGERDTARGEKNNLQSQVAQLNSAVTAKDGEIARLRAALNQPTGGNATENDLRRQIGQLEQERQNLIQQRDELQGQVNTERAAKQTAEQQRDTAQAELKTLAQRLEEAQAENTQLREELATLKSDAVPDEVILFGNPSLDLAQLQQDNQQLSEQLGIVQAALQDAERQKTSAIEGKEAAIRAQEAAEKESSQAIAAKEAAEKESSQAIAAKEEATAQAIRAQEALVTEQEQLGIVQAALQDSEREKATAIEQRNTAREAKQQAEAELTAVNTQIASLEKQLADALDRSIADPAEIAKLEESLEEARKDAQQKQEKIDSLENDNSELRKEIKVLSASLNKLQERLEQTKAEVLELTRTVNNQQDELVSYEEAARIRVQELDDLQHRLEQAEAEAEDLARIVSNQQAELASYEEAAGARVQELDTLQQEVEQAQREAAKQTRSVEGLKAQLAEIASAEEEERVAQNVQRYQRRFEKHSKKLDKIRPHLTIKEEYFQMIVFECAERLANISHNLLQNHATLGYLKTYYLNKLLDLAIKRAEGNDEFDLSKEVRKLITDFLYYKINEKLQMKNKHESKIRPLKRKQRREELSPEEAQKLSVAETKRDMLQEKINELREMITHNKQDATWQQDHYQEIFSASFSQLDSYLSVIRSMVINQEQVSCVARDDETKASCTEVTVPYDEPATPQHGSQQTPPAPPVLPEDGSAPPPPPMPTADVTAKKPSTKRTPTKKAPPSSKSAGSYGDIGKEMAAKGRSSLRARTPEEIAAREQKAAAKRDASMAASKVQEEKSVKRGLLDDIKKAGGIVGFGFTPEAERKKREQQIERRAEEWKQKERSMQESLEDMLKQKFASANVSDVESDDEHDSDWESDDSSENDVVTTPSMMRRSEWDDDNDGYSATSCASPGMGRR